MFSRKFIISQVLFLIVCAVTFVILKPFAKDRLAVLGNVAPFEMTASDGKKVSMADLRGHVWIADFMFTTCSGICPMMTRNMQKIYNQFETDDVLRFVSVSVNPENDSPDVLKKYAEKYEIDTAKWMFLSGSREDVQKLAVGSFKLGDIKEPVFHSAKFALVDKKGRIRGYYDGTDDKEVQKLITDIARLRKEG